MSNISFESSGPAGGCGIAFSQSQCKARNRTASNGIDSFTQVIATMPFIGFCEFSSATVTDQGLVITFNDSWPNMYDTITYEEGGYVAKWVYKPYIDLEDNYFVATQTGSQPSGGSYTVTNVTSTQITLDNGIGGTATITVSSTNGTSLNGQIAVCKSLLNQVTPELFISAIGFPAFLPNPIVQGGNFAPTQQTGFFTADSGGNLISFAPDGLLGNNAGGFLHLASDAMIFRSDFGGNNFGAWYGALIGDNYGNLIDKPVPTVAITFPQSSVPVGLPPTQMTTDFIIPFVNAIVSSMGVFYFSGKAGVWLGANSTGTANTSAYSMTIDGLGGSSPPVGSAANLILTAKPARYYYFAPSWLTTMPNKQIIQCPASGMIGLSPTVLAW